MKAKSSEKYLTEAIAIQKQRGEQYDPTGTEERSMVQIVDTFNALTGHNLTDVEGWQFMVILKMVRMNQNGHHEDSCTDMVSYAALAAEASAQNHLDGMNATAIKQKEHLNEILS